LAVKKCRTSDGRRLENNLLRVVDTKGHLPGPDPNRGCYFSFASFKDPDGNGWLLQEITARAPGRGLGLDVTSLADVLREAEQHHGAYEPTAPKHHWSEWYAAFVVAREQGRSPEVAAAEGRLRIERAGESVKA
jgi:hypothetical protein